MRSSTGRGGLVVKVVKVSVPPPPPQSGDWEFESYLKLYNRQSSGFPALYRNYGSSIGTGQPSVSMLSRVGYMQHYPYILCDTTSSLLGSTVEK